MTTPLSPLHTRSTTSLSIRNNNLVGGKVGISDSSKCGLLLVWCLIRLHSSLSLGYYTLWILVWLSTINSWPSLWSLIKPMLKISWPRGAQNRWFCWSIDQDFEGKKGLGDSVLLSSCFRKISTIESSSNWAIFCSWRIWTSCESKSKSKLSIGYLLESWLLALGSKDSLKF